MEKSNILIAFDDSENAMRAVRYVARWFSPQCRLTLFNVIIDTATLCDMDSPELVPIFKSQQSQFCSLENKKRELVGQAIEKAVQVLKEAGFAEENIKIKQQAKQKGVARDILAEAAQGYDLIVIGRHGVSAVRDFFLGSTSHKVFSGARDISVLIVN